MAKRHSIIAPFPGHIDRSHFGSWLSGFVDGEGCFYLRHASRSYGQYGYAGFSIKLRDDDLDVLKLIHSFWRVGSVHHNCKYESGYRNTRPQAKYQVYDALDLSRVIVPHFERFPLLAKKRRDFAIWQQGVALLFSMRHRPKCTKLGVTKWDADTLARFSRLHDELRDIKQYDPPPQMPAIGRSQSLLNGFDE